MNSQINLKGIPKPILTSKANALIVQDIHQDKTKPYDFVVRVGNQSFNKGDIKYVMVEDDVSKGEKWDEVMKDFYAEEKRNHAELAKQTPEYKAKLLDMFSHLYKVATGEYPTQEILDKAYEIQLAFFKENTNRTLCDFYLLSDLIPRSGESDSGRMWDGAKISFMTAYLKIVERAVFRDMQMSGQFKSDYKVKPLETAKVGETVTDANERIERNRTIDNEFDSFVSDAVANF